MPSSKFIHNLFLAHPHDIGETYREHGKFAGSLGLRLTKLGLMSFIHCLIPACFANKITLSIAMLYHEIEARRQIGLAQPNKMSMTCDIKSPRNDDVLFNPSIR